MDKIEWNIYEIYEWIKLSGKHNMESMICFKVKAVMIQMTAES